MLLQICVICVISFESGETALHVAIVNSARSLYWSSLADFESSENQRLPSAEEDMLILLGEAVKASPHKDTLLHKALMAGDFRRECSPQLSPVN